MFLPKDDETVAVASLDGVRLGQNRPLVLVVVVVDGRNPLPFPIVVLVGR